MITTNDTIQCSVLNSEKHHVSTFPERMLRLHTKLSSICIHGCLHKEHTQRNLRQLGNCFSSLHVPPIDYPAVSPEVTKERVDCVVIGAGVVGLAIARQMAKRGRDVLVVEAASTFGTGTSSRNSEVIHAGLHYPSGSLKARLCVEGRKALYSYCQAHGVAHKQLGKVIVATDTRQIPSLESIALSGRNNGVEDLRLLTSEEATGLEPNLTCVKALWSPSTGILDSHSLMLSLQADAEAHSATFAFNSTISKGLVVSKGIELYVYSTHSLSSEKFPNQVDAESMILCANTVVNAAGLSATAVARRLDGFPIEALPEQFYARGCYFSLSGVGKAPFSHLVYPIPEEGGLGVHVTQDLGGQMRFGPDVEWLDDIDGDTAFNRQFDYTVDPRRAERFYSEIRKYYPSLPDGALKYDYAGIRPKTSRRGNPAADFVIQGQDSHGIHGLINLFGIESPGLTACLSIADMVCAMSC